MPNLESELEELKKFHDSFLKDPEKAYEGLKYMGSYYDQDEFLLQRQVSYREGFAAGFNKALTLQEES